MLLRSFFTLSALSGVIAEDALTMIYSGQVLRGRTLEEVYGKVKPVEAMKPRYASNVTREKLTTEYLKHRAQENCDFPIELVIVQDATNSFSDDIVNMRQVQLNLMIDALAQSHPGSAFALVTFRDKPLWPLGEIGDYCTRFDAPLSTQADSIINAYSNLVVSGGGDPPESQFSTIIAAAQSSTPGWGTVPLAARLIVVVTDAAPHFEGDGFNVYNLPPFSGNFEEANNDRQCITQYYPTPFSVQSALSARGAYLGSLVYDGSYDSSLPIESWKWFNSFLGQTAPFVFDIESDSSNFWEQLSKIVTELENVECGITTTPSPTTSVMTNTPAPTATLSQGTTAAATTAQSSTVASSVLTTPAATSTPAITTSSSDQTVTPVGTVIAPSMTGIECPPCPPCHETSCPPCPCEGVKIHLSFRPAKLHLDVEK